MINIIKINFHTFKNISLIKLALLLTLFYTQTTFAIETEKEKNLFLDSLRVIGVASGVPGISAFCIKDNQYPKEMEKATKAWNERNHNDMLFALRTLEKLGGLSKSERVDLDKQLYKSVRKIWDENDDKSVFCVKHLLQMKNGISDLANDPQVKNSVRNIKEFLQTNP